MGTSVTFNNVSYTVPSVGEAFGTVLSNYLIAIASGSLQKSGGAFTLTAEADFGATYGLKSAYFKSRGVAASAGVVRLANTETVAWRNAANSADLGLAVNASDRLAFDSVVVPTVDSTDTLTNKTISGSDNTLSDLDYSSLVLTNSIIDADINASAAISHSKLASTTAGYILLGNSSGVVTGTAISGDISVDSSGVTSIAAGAIVDADVSASAAIAHSKLDSITAGSVLLGNGSNVPTATAISGDISIDSSGVVALTAGSIVDADVNAGAAIAYSKLDLAGSVDLTSDVTGTLPIANGGTGQTTANAALNALLPDQTGKSGNVLATDGTDTAWAAALTSTLTDGYIFVGNASNEAAGVAVSGDISLSNAGVASITAGAIVDADINASASIAVSKLAAGTNNALLYMSSGSPAWSDINKLQYDGTDLYLDGVFKIVKTTGNDAQLYARTGSAGTVFGYIDVSNGRSYILQESNSGDAQINIGFGSVSSGVPSNTVLHINRDGEVGIGTTSPGSALHVVGSIQVNTTTDVIYSNNFSAVSGSTSMRFSTSGVMTWTDISNNVKMYLDTSTSFFGIGGIVPDSPLHVEADTGSGFLAHFKNTSDTPYGVIIEGSGDNSSGYPLLGVSSAGGWALRVDSVSGSVGMNSLEGTGSRAVNADANGYLSASSDSRLKQEMLEASIPGLEEILQITPKAYKWLKDIEIRGDEAAIEIGFFADEIAPVIPSAAPMGRDGYYGLYDRSITAALVNAVKELAARLAILEGAVS